MGTLFVLAGGHDHAPPFPAATDLSESLTQGVLPHLEGDLGNSPSAATGPGFLPLAFPRQGSGNPRKTRVSERSGKVQPRLAQTAGRSQPLQGQAAGTVTRSEQVRWAAGAKDATPRLGTGTSRGQQSARGPRRGLLLWPPRWSS